MPINLAFPFNAIGKAFFGIKHLKTYVFNLINTNVNTAVKNNLNVIIILYITIFFSFAI